MDHPILASSDLRGKTIDIHSHSGLSLKAYARREYPFAATVEGIYYRQKAGGVDVNVVFPFSADLFFDPVELAGGVAVPAAAPLSPAPYAVENELVLQEVYDFCPELSGRFLPFVSFDPGREVDAQIRHVRSLHARYPIYGIKIAPVLCQSPITALLKAGRAILDLAREKAWPLLFHTTAQKEEAYSNADLCFEVIDRHPDLRFCLAHCIGFHREHLRRADRMPNVWVDTSALKIQVQATREGNPAMAAPADRIDADYADHKRVLSTLTDRYPATMIWGTDTPAYAYMSRRQQAEGVTVDFRLKGRYEDEVEALDSLAAEAKRRISTENALVFLFGEAGSVAQP